MKALDARIVLTGAAGGIGTAAAAAFVKAGAAVMLVGRSPARLASQARSLVRDCDASAQRVAWHAADLNKSSSLAELSEAASAWDCNVLVHGAGLPSFGRLESLSPGDIAQVLQTNLLAPMLLTRALLPHLHRLSRAQVICVGSALGRIGLPGYSVYSASKFGLRGFAEALRRELDGTGVRVLYIGPRSTRTAFNSADVELYNRATGTAMDSPEVVARALVQLMESEAAERFLGFPEALAVRMNGLVPSLMDGAFVKHRNSLPALSRANAESDSSPLNSAL